MKECKLEEFQMRRNWVFLKTLSGLQIFLVQPLNFCMDQHPHLYQFVRKCLEKNFSFSQPLPPTLQAASTDIPTSTSEKSKNSIGQRPSGCSAAQRDAPRLLNREFIEKRLTRDTHKYRELFKTDIPLMPHESWKVLTFYNPLQVISLNYLYYCLFMSFFKSHWCFAQPVT